MLSLWTHGLELRDVQKCWVMLNKQDCAEWAWGVSLHPSSGEGTSMAQAGESGGSGSHSIVETG